MKIMTKNYKVGDILLFVGGKMALVKEIGVYGSKDMCIVQYMDKADESYEIMRDKHILTNFGQSQEILAMFHMTKSIHVRLNKLREV